MVVLKDVRARAWQWYCVNGLNQFYRVSPIPLNLSIWSITNYHWFNFTLNQYYIIIVYRFFIVTDLNSGFLCKNISWEVPWCWGLNVENQMSICFDCMANIFIFSPQNIFNSWILTIQHRAYLFIIVFWRTCACESVCVGACVWNAVIQWVSLSYTCTCIECGVNAGQTSLNRVKLANTMLNNVIA